MSVAQVTLWRPHRRRHATLDRLSWPMIEPGSRQPETLRHPQRFLSFFFFLQPTAERKYYEEKLSWNQIAQHVAAANERRRNTHLVLCLKKKKGGGVEFGIFSKCLVIFAFVKNLWKELKIKPVFGGYVQWRYFLFLSEIKNVHPVYFGTQTQSCHHPECERSGNQCKSGADQTDSGANNGTTVDC